MKRLPIYSLVLTGAITGSAAFATSYDGAWENLNLNRDATINVYGVGAKIDKDQKSSAGMGLMFDSEAIKVKVEGTSDFVKSGLVLKLNPFIKDWYFKLGANYLNQKVYAPDSTNTRVDQYSAALASGYMLSDDFYAEVGGSYTKLNGEVFGLYEIKDETTKLAYLEVAKRWESAIGTLDTTANAGRVFYEYKENESSYGVGVDYYPLDNAKLSYSYQHEKVNIVNAYSMHYSFLFVEYVDNISRNSYQLNAGLKLAFDELFDFTTYRAPQNIKSHLSELHRFENLTLTSNMQLQSTAGVQKLQTALEESSPTPEVSNHAPVWTQSVYDTGLTIVDDNDDPKTIMDLTAVSSDADGDNLTYTIVSISTPNVNDDTPWANSLSIQNGVLQAQNLVTNDPNFDGTVSVVVKVSDGTSSSTTTVNFDFLNYQ